MTITSPEAIFLFGGLAKSGKYIFEPTQWYMEENMMSVFKNKVKLLPSGIQSQNAAILGASALIWQEETARSLIRPQHPYRSYPHVGRLLFFMPRSRAVPPETTGTRDDFRHISAKP